MSVVRIIEGPYYRGYFYKECMGISRDQVNCPYQRGVRTERRAVWLQVKRIREVILGVALPQQYLLPCCGNR